MDTPTFKQTTIISLTPVSGWRLSFTVDPRPATSPVIALAMVVDPTHAEAGTEIHPLAVINGKPVLVMDGYELHHLTI